MSTFDQDNVRVAIAFRSPMLAFEEVSETVSRGTTSKAGSAATQSTTMANPEAKRGPEMLHESIWASTSFCIV